MAAPEAVHILADEDLHSVVCGPLFHDFNWNVVNPLPGDHEVLKAIRVSSPVGPPAHILVNQDPLRPNLGKDLAEKRFFAFRCHVVKDVNQKHDIECSGWPSVADIEPMESKFGMGSYSSGPPGHPGGKIDPLMRHVEAHSLEFGTQAGHKAEKQARTATDIQNPGPFADMSH